MDRAACRRILLALALTLLAGVVYAGRRLSDAPPRGLERLALEELQARADIQPDSFWIQLELGKRCLAGGLHDGALQPLQRAVALRPASAPGHFHLGVAYLRLHQPVDGARHLEKAAGLDASYSAAYLELAQAYRDLQDYRSSLRVLDRYVTLSPRDPQGYYRRGSIHALDGRMDRAQRDYETAARLAPDRAAVHLALGQCYLYYRPTPERLKLAEGSFRTAVRLEPDAADAWYHLGLVGLRDGRWKHATQALEQAIRLDPADAQARYAMSQACLRLGRTQQAQQQLAHFQRLREPVDLRRPGRQ